MKPAEFRLSIEAMADLGNVLSSAMLPAFSPIPNGPVRRTSAPESPAHTCPSPTGTGRRSSRWAKRTLIGRVDERTGEIVPTDGRGRRKKEDESVVKPGPVPSVRTARLFYGGPQMSVPGRRL